MHGVQGQPYGPYGFKSKEPGIFTKVRNILFIFKCLNKADMQLLSALFWNEESIYYATKEL